jgi:hypothetical protein
MRQFLTDEGIQDQLIRSYRYPGAVLHGVLFDFTLYSATVTATVSTSLINSAAHGLVNGVRLRFSSTGTLPAPLIPTVDYFVVNSTTGNYQLSASLGGSAIALTTAGTGTITASEQVPGQRDRLPVWARLEANYGGSGRQSISFASLNPVAGGSGWELPLQTFRFSPTTASITYRAMGIIMDGTGTRGNSTGRLQALFDYERTLTIASGSSADFAYAPGLATGT